jgi:DNA-3-methyladenine glycosylase I
MHDEIKRCDWAVKSRLEQEYHDKEWGVPVHDDRKLFKMLILEGKQAGLSWSTILAKLDTLCAAFDDFDPAILVTYDDTKIETLLKNDGIIKNRQKVNAVINNAKAYFKLCEEFGSLDKYLWSYVDYCPQINSWTRIDQLPTSTPLSDIISKDLKKRGFKFVGTTTVYAFMQASGIVNDHITSCAFYRREMKSLAEICDMIELQTEIKDKVLSIDKEYDDTRISGAMNKIYSRDTWDRGLQEIKEALGNDENGIKMLTCMLKCAVITYERYVEKGINNDIFIASLKCFTRFIDEHMVSYGTYAFDRYWWTARQLALQLFRIGELEYEIKATGDEKVISLHIPSDARLTMDHIKESIKKARKFMKQYFPEYAGVKMVCHSWLLSPKLKEVLPEHSNILKFQKLFTILKADENNDYMLWIFKRSDLTIDQLPEDTTLQRNLKAYLKQGGKLGSAYGELVEE